MRMIAYLQEAGEQVTTSGGEVISVSAMLERFLFPPNSHGRKLVAYRVEKNVGYSYYAF